MVANHMMTIPVKVTVIPENVELVNGCVYIYDDGKLIDCGGISCIRGHIDREQVAQIGEHLDPDKWGGRYGESVVHVIRSAAQP